MVRSDLVLTLLLENTAVKAVRVSGLRVKELNSLAVDYTISVPSGFLIWSEKPVIWVLFEGFFTF